MPELDLNILQTEKLPQLLQLSKKGKEKIQMTVNYFDEKGDRIGIADTGKIPVFLGYYSITFDETETVRIPVRCCQNDVGSVDVFRYNTGK